MTLSMRETRPPERHALIDRAAVADFGRFADDDSRAVIDENALTDFGSRVDFDLSQEARDVCKPARQNRNPGALQGMDQPVGDERVEARIR
jgi:hypothetical protein